MKLYKNGKVMQQVDKDQMQDCLDAGWSKTEEVEEILEEEILEEEILEEEILEEEIEVSETPKRTKIKKSSKKRK